MYLCHDNALCTSAEIKAAVGKVWLRAAVCLVNGHRELQCQHSEVVRRLSREYAEKAVIA